jgi:uncharacterized protein YbaR (Trm112 family)
MIAPSILALLRCPETHQTLALADTGLVERLNTQVAAGTLKSKSGKIVTTRLDAGLVRQDGKVLYPVHNNIPVMLAEEAIPLG